MLLLSKQKQETEALILLNIVQHIDGLSLNSRSGEPHAMQASIIAVYATRSNTHVGIAFISATRLRRPSKSSASPRPCNKIQRVVKFNELTVIRIPC